MKNLLLGVAALLALATPSIASAQTGGWLGLGYATLDEDGDPAKDSAYGYGGGVTTNVGNWRIGVNGAAITMDHSSHDDPFGLFEVHGGYDFGMFVLGAHIGRLDLGGSEFDTLGVEGALDLGRFQLAASYTNAEPVFGGTDVDNFTVEGSFNLTDRFSIDAAISQSDFGGGFDGDSYSIGVSYAFDNGLALAGGYRSSEFPATDTDGFNIRLSWSFGEPSRPLPGARELMYDGIAVQ